MKKTVLLIATLDTKEEEAFYLKHRILARGVAVMVMDTGILSPPKRKADISQEKVALQGGMPLKDAVANGDKFACTDIMSRGAERITRSLYAEGRIQGVIGIGGGAGNRNRDGGHEGSAHRRSAFNGLDYRQRLAYFRRLYGHPGSHHHAHGCRHTGPELFDQKNLQKRRRRHLWYGP